MRWKDKEVEEHREKSEKDYEEFRKSILGMPAGREMDALVAKKVMGWKIKHYGGDVFYWKLKGKDIGLVDMWEPSTNIADAWKVVEKFADMPHIFPEIRKSGVWVCSIWKNDAGKKDFGWISESHATTASLAICRAALLAVMANEM